MPQSDWRDERIAKLEKMLELAHLRIGKQQWEITLLQERLKNENGAVIRAAKRMREAG